MIHLNVVISNAPHERDRAADDPMSPGYWYSRRLRGGHRLEICVAGMVAMGFEPAKQGKVRAARLLVRTGPFADRVGGDRGWHFAKLGIVEKDMIMLTGGDTYLGFATDPTWKALAAEYGIDMEKGFWIEARETT